MRSKLFSIAKSVVTAAILVATLVGCPLAPVPPDVSIALLVEPLSLAFGANVNSLTFSVAKTYSARPMAPYQVSSDKDWLSFSPVSGVSEGPEDKITVTATAIRSLMTPGVNVATVIVSSEGLVPIHITATALQILVADFSVSDETPLIDQEIQFMDTTPTPDPLAGDIVSRLWDFGDGATSTEENPTHTYSALGFYDVSLTVIAENAQDTIRRTGFIEVIEAVPPMADFAADMTEVVDGQAIQFMSTGDEGSVPIATYAWDFGDGSTSDEANPTMTYAVAGVYDVSLTVSNDIGTATELKKSYIVVGERVPPVVDFSVDRQEAFPGDELQFTAEITEGSFPVTERTWSFGDGTTSTAANPTHAYGTTGLKTVSLEVKTVVDEVEETKTDYINIRELTPLDAYIRNGDDSFDVSLSETPSEGDGFRTHLLNVVSQSWLTIDEVYSINGERTNLWNHNLTIIEPIDSPTTKQVDDTALLIVDGGDNGDSFPGTATLGILEGIANQTGSVVALLSQVPNQPITVEPGRRATSYSDDSLVAFSFARFFASDPKIDEHPVLLPMAKSVVRGMDAVQEYLDGRGVDIENFVLTGTSNQGWAAWLAAAGDPDGRVIGLAPLASDVLNMGPVYQRQSDSYGALSVANEFVSTGVDADILGANGPSLFNIVDPYLLRDRFTMPKYVVNATGDELYVPDSAQFYFGELPNEKRINYIPNVGASMGLGLGNTNLSGPLAAFFAAVSEGTTPPAVAVDYVAPGRIDVTPSETPLRVTLWQALDSSIETLDFREGPDQADDITPVWTSSAVVGTNNLFMGEVDVPGQDGGWNAFFVQVEFEGGFVFSSEVRIVGDPPPFGK
jgi:PhoPQ-activated pathogenicity-related protein